MKILDRPRDRTISFAIFQNQDCQLQDVDLGILDVNIELPTRSPKEANKEFRKAVYLWIDIKSFDNWSHALSSLIDNLGGWENIDYIKSILSVDDSWFEITIPLVDDDVSTIQFFTRQDIVNISKSGSGLGISSF